MNDLAVRKRLLVAEADLHRQVFDLERRQLEAQWAGAHIFVDRSRWWLVGGAVAAGLLLKPSWRGLIGLVPTLGTAGRELQR